MKRGSKKRTREVGRKRNGNKGGKERQAEQLEHTSRRKKEEGKRQEGGR